MQDIYARLPEKVLSGFKNNGFLLKPAVACADNTGRVYA